MFMLGFGRMLHPGDTRVLQSLRFPGLAGSVVARRSVRLGRRTFWNSSLQDTTALHSFSINRGVPLPPH
ncbi:hypothetical protein BDV39DRAFT_170546 [Aspergillus sergii]|uniref:Uncharacterized protein n=1 Tax=Aspergillus sergii TaxID=1034303 RepID=A0A5N6XC10_9EURO|nr:hypothetical protein BDV39DRAFT_170546 [Aspergillus sergii]